MNKHRIVVGYGDPTTLVSGLVKHLCHSRGGGNLHADLALPIPCPWMNKGLRPPSFEGMT